jgi:DegV family protein with EDD domain
MKTVVVVTDSSATLPEALVQELDIRVVPILLHLAGRTYRDGIDLTPDEFYRWLRTNMHVPTTSAPSAGDFVRVFAAAGRASAGVVAIHVPPQLSVTHDLAVAATRLVDGSPIRVVDSRSIAMGQGFVVLEADLSAVVARANEVASRVRLFFTLETLQYLHRGGRIGGAAALVGSVLQIKPLLQVINGRVEPMAKPRTRRKAIRMMLQIMAEHVGNRPAHAAVVQADAAQEAEELKQRLAEQFACVELHVTEFTPAMGAHVGPGLLGVAFYVD